MPNLPSIPDIAKQVDLNKTDILSIQNFLPTVTNESAKAINGFFRDRKTGITIQWGRTENEAFNTITCNFPVAFSNTNYKVVATKNWVDSSVGAHLSQSIGTFNYTNSSFALHFGTSEQRPLNTNWIAIGW